MEMSEYKLGRGLDVGTSFLVASRMTVGGEVEFKSERDAFFTLTPQGKANTKMIEQMLTQRGAFALKDEGKFHVVGKHALELANVRLQPVDRPLKKGVISDSEAYSFAMLSKLIESILWEASAPDELCVYTYPSDPIDANFDIIYHKDRMKEILNSLGYKAVPLLESMALAYSELLEDGLTGLVVSCGAGMVNISLLHLGQDLKSFSIATGGDYIDKSVAKQQRISETIVQEEKESGINLLKPQDKLQRTIVIYYDAFINYVVDAIEKEFSSMLKVPRFGSPIPVIVAGGTSLPEGYLEKMSMAFLSKELPFPIGDIRHASNPDPLKSVANGCLLYAQLELEEQG
jgi:hypothetical protein